MDLHPNVKVPVEFDLEGQEHHQLTLAQREQREQAYYTRLRVELMSGEAEGILFGSSERLNSYQLSRSGVLLDLRPYWENDSEIDESDYFMEVLDAFAADGKRTVIPLPFAFSCVYLNRDVLKGLNEELDTRFAISTEELLTWYEQAREGDPELQLFFSAPGKDALFPIERPDHLDFASGTAGFASPEFLRFLERTNAVLNDDPNLDPNEEIGRSYGALANELLRYKATGKEPVTVTGGMDNFPPYRLATMGRTSLATLEAVSLYQLMNLEQPLEYMAGLYPLTSSGGRLGVDTEEDFSVPASCKNPELAWEFIKHCIREREDFTFSRYGGHNADYTAYFALNRKNFLKMVEDMPNTVKRTYFPGYIAFEPVDGEELLKKLESFFFLELVNTKQYGLDVGEYLDEYYIQALITAPQCADKIQGRAEIWL